MNCPKCYKENCIVDVVNDKTTAYLCFECGYRTMSDYNVKNFEFQPTLINMDSETKKMIWKDLKTGLYWFPISFEIPKVGVLYPQGDVDNMEWVYMSMIDLTDEQKRKYPGKREIPDEYSKKIFTKSNLKESLRLLKIIE